MNRVDLTNGSMNRVDLANGPTRDARASTSTWEAAVRSRSPSWDVAETRSRPGRHISIDDIPVTHTYLQDSGEESDTPSTVEESSSSRGSGDSSSVLGVSDS